MAKFRVIVKTNKVGSECVAGLEIPDEELGGLTAEERESYIVKEAFEVAMNSVDWWHEELSENGDED